MRIRRLKLENWRNFRRADAPLPVRVFLAGPTAAGKTNFCDALRFLKELAEGGFQGAVRRRGGVSRIRCRSARHPADVALDVHFSDEQGTDWRYRIVFSQDEGNRPVIVSESAWKGTEQLLNRPDQKDKRDAERLLQTALEQSAENREFRSISDGLRRITYRRPLAEVIRDPQRFSLSAEEEDIFGASLLSHMAASPERTRNSRLKMILEVLRSAEPQLHELDLQTNASGSAHLVGKYAHWRLHDARQFEGDFSDGTLRLIAVFWYILEGDAPVLIEEPETGLHPGWVEHLAPILRRLQRRKSGGPRQAIFSTQSSYLLADGKIHPEEILLLIPGRETTEIAQASSFRDAKDLLESRWSSLPELPPEEPGDDQLDMPFL